jgi:trans-aconitate methyltransferase
MAEVQRYTRESLAEIQTSLRARIDGLEPGDSLRFQALDPDWSSTHYGGEPVEVDEAICIYRSWAVWADLAEVLGCRLCTPRALGDDFVEIRLFKLNRNHSWHARSGPSGDPEKYGSETDFARIQKFEEPSFLRAFADSIDFVALPPAARVLCLGVNQGDELGFFQHRVSPEALGQMTLVGIDHSATAIDAARLRFPGASFDFRVGDLKNIESLELGLFDLVIAINTLHSPDLGGQAILRRMVTHHLTPRGGVILGFPNSRYVDHGLCYGGKVKNYRYPEHSVVLKEVTAYKRYLHQHRFQVTVTGKHTLLVTGHRHSPPADH